MNNPNELNSELLKAHMTNNIWFFVKSSSKFPWLKMLVQNRIIFFTDTVEPFDSVCYTIYWSSTVLTSNFLNV